MMINSDKPGDIEHTIAQIENSHEPVRVLVITDAAPDRNGVGSYYADLVQQLQGRVSGAALFHPGNQQAPGYRYLTAPLPGDKTQRVSIPRPVHLWRAVRAAKPTVIVVPTPGPYGLAGLLLARHYKLPLLIGFHTHYEALAEMYWHNGFGRIAQYYLNWCNRLLFRHSNMVLANSPEMLSQALHCGAKQAALMGTSVQQDFIDTPEITPNKTIKRVLFAGRLADEKNLPAIINAAKEHRGIEFSIAGDGPLRQLVENASDALPNLSYLGWIPRSELISVIDQHDVLLLPSKVESFGTVALEGMARARLVIVSSTCGITEWPELMKALVVVKPDECASDTLHRILDMDPNERVQLCQFARTQSLHLNEWNIQSWLSRLQKPGFINDYDYGQDPGNAQVSLSLKQQTNNS